MSSKNKLNKLFENSDSEDESTLKTNSSYAKHYDEFRKKEIMSHCKYLSLKIRKHFWLIVLNNFSEKH